VKISVPSAGGREIVLSVMREGDIFGEIALLDGRPHGVDATATTDCDLMVIEYQDFLLFLRSQPDLTIQIIEILCARLRRRTEQVQDMTFLNLPARLAKTLLRLTADIGRSSSALKLTVTQREISQIIGRSRRSTNQQLRSWTKQGVIHLERGVVVILNRDKLADVAAQGLEFDRS
jgi:CRP-like cAMP-binding protein